MYMHELKEKLCEELEEIARKPEMSAGDLEAAHKLTDTIKNIDKIEMLEEDGGYSRAGDWEADMRGTYARGSSYRGRKRDSMGRYSRDGRMGGYSRHDAKEAMMEQAREMMEDATNEREREAIRRFMTELERD
jgi:hypothetical protein|nr:MAG TPA: hypothetical protein [Caudoviricetes sp.]